MRKLGVLLTIMSLLLLPNLAQAVEVRGLADISNNNIEKAREEARKDALRNHVESNIGVYVKSKSTMVNNMVIEDKVATESNGYVVVKRIVSERIIGSKVLELVLDVESSGKQPIDVADTKTALSSLSESSNRSGLDVAILGENSQEQDKYNTYFQQTLREQGFKVTVNDDVLCYLARNIHLDAQTVKTEVRRIGRISRGADSNAIARGRVELTQSAYRVGNGYRAIASVSSEIVGYDNDLVDSFVGYAAGFASGPREAERKAREECIRRATAYMAKVALQTEQLQTQGGVRTVKSLFVFTGLSDRLNEKRAIVAALTRANCRVIRSNFLRDGSLQIYLAGQVATADELKERVETAVGRAANTDEASLGSTKYIINM